MKVQKRSEIAFAVPVVAGLVAALLVNGWLFSPISPWIGLAIALIGGGLAGVLSHPAPLEKLLNGAAGVVAAIGIVVATVWYLEGRSSVIKVELLVPVVLGALPGLAVLLVLQQLRRWPCVQAVSSSGAVLAAVVVWLSWPAPGAGEATASAVAPPPSRSAALLFSRDDRHLLIGAYGASAREFFTSVDMVNSMTDIYGLPQVAREAPKMLVKLREALTRWQDVVRRRKAHGAELEGLPAFRAVEHATEQFLSRAEALGARAAAKTD